MSEQDENSGVMKPYSWFWHFYKIFMQLKGSIFRLTKQAFIRDLLSRLKIVPSLVSDLW